MSITRLTLTDFRNHGSADLLPGPRLVVLHGANGAGKTNVLEAVSLLAPGRGMRRATFDAMARHGGPGGFTVAAAIDPDDGGDPVLLGTGISPDAPGRRQVRINGAVAPANALGEWLSLIWLTPAMDRLFTDSAGSRRRFLDRMVLALVPGHAHHSARYEAAMRARTRLLTDPARVDAAWLTALESQMAEHGHAVSVARRDLVAALAEELAALPDAPFARPVITLARGAAEQGATEDPARLAAQLAQQRRADAAAGRALVGPHRDDLAVVHAAKDQPAALCSTGEQKALLLSLVLAHGDLVARRRGARPILLLDELAAHLDPVRRAALFERIDAGGGQAWVTGTEAALFDDLPPATRRFVVEDGRVVPD